MRLSTASFIALTCASSIVAAQEEVPDDPSEDIRVTGWEGRITSVKCVSVGSDGSVIDGLSLPVGDGRWLECQSDVSYTRQTNLFPDNGVESCALGESTEWKGSSDFSVTTTSIEPNVDGPWKFRAEATNGPTTVTPSQDHLGLGYAWSVGAYVRYKVIDVRPKPEAMPCSTLWDLPDGA